MKGKHSRPVGYTVVRHSAYGYGGDTDFIRGLESRALHTETEAEKVRKAGGVIFTDYAHAEEYAERVQYPPDVRGLIPRAPGDFAPGEIDGLQIYLPPVVMAAAS